MQVTNNFFYAQNLAGANKNAQVNPLLKKAVDAVENRSKAVAADGASEDMEARIRKMKEQARINPQEELERKLMEELMFAEQDFYGELGKAKLQLTSLLRQKETYAGIVNGTADYDKLLLDALAQEDENSFGKHGIVSFESYIKDNGYYESGKEGFDVSDAENMVVLKDLNGLDMPMPASLVPVYDQWYNEQVGKLKTHASGQIPLIQKRIEEFPRRISTIVMEYNIRRMEILAKLPQDSDKLKKYKEDVKTVEGLAELLRTEGPADGEKILELLNRMLDTQQGIVRDLGGVANDVFDGILGGTPRLPSFRPMDLKA